MGSEKNNPTSNVAVPGLEKESKQRVAKAEEPVPSETREAGPMDPAAMGDYLQKLLKDAEEAFPVKKRGWLAFK